MASTGSKKMSTGNVYKQAIKRVFANKYHDIGFPAHPHGAVFQIIIPIGEPDEVDVNED
jgi:hypothetical protein